ncbi:hypothetical protein M885DRAFT_505493 [Pelagophyceae sp. CCMP2097]|nr:hypothetical protein M885DRAFT_505493 [Pelagophyceae sp. CCMP2097]|eukprot:CAMPEP_0184128666 /NCGR_PEP_ID=MMETSP0974-20121125/26695_1 /TAXON_ID=483370 /ORGANISM="non described non described, Strain CCMP2097" /LENGTH=77 /DNA_ID=CAMNT_0026432091 /DNA_START=23 /DNA_END=256 /DNA_ORIENTATION=+
MPLPEPVAHGTLVFASIVAALSVTVIFGRLIGLVKKDGAQISLVLVSLMGFCMWLLWVCTWMHQWHPLITPMYPDSE